MKNTQLYLMFQLQESTDTLTLFVIQASTYNEHRTK